MDNRPTLEEQLLIERLVYSGGIMKKIGKEKIFKLYWGLYDAPIYVVRDAMKLFEKIMIDEDSGCLTPKKYIKKPEDLSAFLWLIKSDLIEVQEHRYFFGIFKKGVIVSKDNYLKNIKTIFDSLSYEALKTKHAGKKEISFSQRKS